MCINLSQFIFVQIELAGRITYFTCVSVWDSIRNVASNNKHNQSSARAHLVRAQFDFCWQNKQSVIRLMAALFYEIEQASAARKKSKSKMKNTHQPYFITIEIMRANAIVGYLLSFLVTSKWNAHMHPSFG